MLAVPSPIVFHSAGLAPAPSSSFQPLLFGTWTLPTTGVSVPIVLPFEMFFNSTASEPVLFSVGAMGMPRSLARAMARSALKPGSLTNFFVTLNCAGVWSLARKPLRLSISLSSHSDSYFTSVRTQAVTNWSQPPAAPLSVVGDWNDRCATFFGWSEANPSSVERTWRR